MLAPSKVIARMAPNFGEVELDMHSCNYNSKYLSAFLVCKTTHMFLFLFENVMF
jgi:hypothetical protein